MKRLSRNDAVLVSCLGVVALMTGASYAAVPLYYLFCEVTGFGGTPQRADAAPGSVADAETITVSFDSNVDRSLNWSFKPVQRQVKVKPGEDSLVFYRATNNDTRPVIGHASFNVAPAEVGRYFKKIECFCFQEQRLEPGQSIDMPVSFFVDPAMLKDRENKHITQMTLSYTFYPSATAQAEPSGS